MQQRSSSPVLGKILMALAILGAINWGLIGIFNFNLVDAIFGGGAQEITSTASRIIYALVGVAGLCAIPFLFTRTVDVPGTANKIHVTRDDRDYTGRDYVRP